MITVEVKIIAAKRAYPFIGFPPIKRWMSGALNAVVPGHIGFNKSAQR
jgi:hypothetical protein